ncbi:hypothetical protein PXK01_16545 [Phaeobacter sp. PT47_59]|uniref:hypothetical protein n=1 Tax=Phaeobacter sp. PT47_59 TaxID=3029979 RepID=UPI00237FF7E5|nr:hypothetical protein [Phaeobacter sp. PT47_59]MDE4175773.1 hypothetical protein [Phaeobacter sp. PT47_59]
MNAETFDFPMPSHDRVAALIDAAKEYCAAREAFAKADQAMGSERHAVGPHCDELDAAADQLGATQQRVADLALALTSDGTFDAYCELLAAETAGRP